MNVLHCFPGHPFRPLFACFSLRVGGYPFVVSLRTAMNVLTCVTSVFSRTGCSSHSVSLNNRNGSIQTCRGCRHLPVVDCAVCAVSGSLLAIAVREVSVSSCCLHRYWCALHLPRVPNTGWVEPGVADAESSPALPAGKAQHTKKIQRNLPICKGFVPG